MPWFLPILSVVGFLASWAVYDHYATEIGNMVDWISSMVFVEGLTFDEFLGMYWIHIVAFFVLLYVFLVVAFPSNKSKENK